MCMGMKYYLSPKYVGVLGCADRPVILNLNNYFHNSGNVQRARIKI